MQVAYLRESAFKISKFKTKDMGKLGERDTVMGGAGICGL